VNWFSWLQRPATAWALAGLTVVLAVALVPLSLAARQNPFAAGGATVVVAVSFAVVGLPGTGRGTRSGGSCSRLARASCPRSTAAYTT
jgi:hypothetical protein